MSKIVIGIDQSYDRTGISVLKDKEIISIEYLSGKKLSRSVFRKQLRGKLFDILLNIGYNTIQKEKVIIIFERIRLKSNGNLSLKYIQATGALCSAVIDIAEEFGVSVYSVDTRAWKSAIVGTSKPQENRHGIDPKKYPTILYMRQKGLLSNIIEPYEGRGSKGIIWVRNGAERFRARIIDDMADSYCIALYGFLPENRQKLQKEDF